MKGEVRNCRREVEVPEPVPLDSRRAWPARLRNLFVFKKCGRARLTRLAIEVESGKPQFHCSQVDCRDCQEPSLTIK